MSRRRLINLLSLNRDSLRRDNSLSKDKPPRLMAKPVNTAKYRAYPAYKTRKARRASRPHRRPICPKAVRRPPCRNSTRPNSAPRHHKPRPPFPVQIVLLMRLRPSPARPKPADSHPYPARKAYQLANNRPKPADSHLCPARQLGVNPRKPADSRPCPAQPEASKCPKVRAR